MVEVLVIEFQGVVDGVELYAHPLDADARADHLILQHYGTMTEYREALADSNADYVVLHFTDVEVR